ncbi:hypothetical protein N9A71_05895 [Porticoccaceae bacterium]|nr:hypothetical protein [Porticoccaceae bacterium]
MDKTIDVSDKKHLIHLLAVVSPAALIIAKSHLQVNQLCVTF